MNAATFFKKLNNPIYFSFYQLVKLPSSFYSGIKIEDASSEKVVASVPYKYFSKNPFRSTYFACLAMAAEMATGIVAMAATKCFNKKISMLIVNLEADFYKKATERVYFECNGFENVKQAIQTSIDANQPQQVKLISKGTFKDGTPVAEFIFTWSFKVKSN